MNPAMITTIIPTHGRPQLLRRSIKSALNQTYPDLQVCVYDDASSYETADTVAELKNKDPRVFYWRHSKNVGSVKNYNFAFKNIQTPFFSLLGDDDVLLPDFYEIAMRSLQKYSQAAFYAGEVISMQSDGIILKSANASWADAYLSPPEGLLAMLEHGHHPPIWTGTLFRSSIIPRIGLLDEETGCTYDYDYTQRIAAALPYVKSQTPVAIYVVHPQSASSCTDHSITWPGSLKMIRNVTDNDHLPLAIRKRVKHYLNQALKARIICYGKKYLLAEKYDQAYQVAGILRYHLNSKIWALLIYLVARGCQKIPRLHNRLLKLIALRHRLSDQKPKAVNPDSAKYAHYLTLD